VKPEVTAFFDPDTNTVSSVVKDPATPACAVIDSVLDFDYASGRIGYRSADAIIRHIREHGLSLAWLIETHVHADHLSAAPYIQGELGGKLGIGNRVTGAGDHDRPDWLITMTGIRMEGHAQGQGVAGGPRVGGLEELLPEGCRHQAPTPRSGNQLPAAILKD
jgi:glyoxylase-like metal-dependent hydrolase (beta-lactamase superfamily II)